MYRKKRPGRLPCDLLKNAINRIIQNPIETGSVNMKQNEVDKIMEALLKEASAGVGSSAPSQESHTAKTEEENKEETLAVSPVEDTAKPEPGDGETKLKNKIKNIEESMSTDGIRAIEDLAFAARNLAEGKIKSNVQTEVKGVLGELASSINQTILNIQQMDSSLKESQKEIPDLAEQLDSVSKDTEIASNNILNQLDNILNTSDENVKQVKKLDEQYEAEFKLFREYSENFKEFQKGVTNDANATIEERNKQSQKVFEFLSLFSEELQGGLTAKEELREEIKKSKEMSESIQSTVLDIFNEFQFQDISRQKIQRIILLLKEIDSRIERLLVIFNIKKENKLLTKKKEFRVSEHIESVSLEKDSKKEDVDDIVGNFFQNK